MNSLNINSRKKRDVLTYMKGKKMGNYKCLFNCQYFRRIKLSNF